MRIGVLMNRMHRPFLNPVNPFNLTIHFHSKEEEARWTASFDKKIQKSSKKLDKFVTQ